MEPPFGDAIRTPAPPYHADHADNVRRRGDHGGEKRVEAERLDNLRQEETQTVIRRHGAEIYQAQSEYPRVHQRLRDGVAAHRQTLALLERQSLGEPAPLVRREPRRIGRTVGQIEKYHARQEDCWHRFDDEQPLPTGESEPAMKIQQYAGHRPADHGRERDGGHEIADDPGAIFGRKPQRQVKDDAREEAGFGRAEQDTDQIEAVLVAPAGGAGDVWNKCHQAGENSPAQHDAGDPFAGAEPLQQQVGWHFEDEVGEEEDARAEAERSLRQAEILVHRQRGKADIDPIEIRDEVADDEEWYETFGDLREGADFYFMHDSGA